MPPPQEISDLRLVNRLPLKKQPHDPVSEEDRVLPDGRHLTVSSWHRWGAIHI